MNAPARATPANPILRNAAGEPPLGKDALFFRDEQGEMFFYDRDRSPSAKLGVLELEDGLWLAHPPGFLVEGARFADRNVALQSAIARLIRKARKNMRAKEDEGTHWSEGLGGRVIEWALGLKPERATKASENITENITDPVVAGLLAAHRSRKAFPAAHLFSKTNPIINGQMVTMGTCSCGKVFSYKGELANEHLDAVIELHLQSFDHLQEKVDGRGRAIVATPAPEKKSRKRKHSDGSGSPVADNPDDPAAVSLQQGLDTSSNPGTVDTRSQGEGSDAASVANPEGRPDVPDGSPVSPGPSETQPGAGGHSLASIIADDVSSPHLRSESVPSPAPSGADSILSALRAIAAGEQVDGPIVLDLVRQGLVHATTTRIILTEAGEAMLQQGAPIGAGSTEVSEPPETGLAAPGFRATDPVRETGLHGGSLALSDDDDWLLPAAAALAWRESPTVSETLRSLLDFSKVYGRSAGDVERPVLRWHGGKWRLAPWIISHFPEHRVYVEPFGGAASVLLRKRRSYAEVYNDLDREVVSFFRILQDPQQSARLIELLYITPFARDEFELGYKESGDPIERARRLVVRAFMGHGSDSMAGVVSGFRANSNKSGTTPAHDWVNYVTALPLAIDRLRGCVIEQRDGVQVMTTHDAETTLHYVDPPYLPETRTWMTSGKGKGNYRHELDPEGHSSLLSSLLSLKGMVVLSGYPSELYDQALSDWRRIETDAYADGARPRTEVVWLNPACVAALDLQHPTLFNIPALDVANTPPSDVAGIDA